MLIQKLECESNLRFVVRLVAASSSYFSSRQFAPSAPLGYKRMSATHLGLVARCSARLRRFGDAGHLTCNLRHAVGLTSIDEVDSCT